MTDWRHASAQADRCGAQWRPRLVSAAGVTVWQGTPAVSWEGALHAARARRRALMRVEGAETVNLPGDFEEGGEPATGPAQAVPAVPPWDGDWDALVPGVTAAGEKFNATLHDRSSPFTSRWECSHGHLDAGAAEVCALHQRGHRHQEALARARAMQPGFSAPPYCRHGGTVHDESCFRPARGWAWSATDEGVTVRVTAPAGSRVSTRLTGGMLEVTVSPPGRD